MNAPDVVVVCAYVTLVVELTVFPIPSEASTLQLFTVRAEGDGALAQARQRTGLQKLLRFFVPTALCVALSLLPLLGIFWPDSRDVLFFWRLPDAVWVGVVLVGLGRLITFGSVLQLRAAKRRDAIPGGVFRISRNPGLCGMYAFYVGLCLIYGGPWMWFGLPLYLGNMHHRVLLEEANLRARHAADWQSYATRVARYLPLPGLR